MIKEGAMPMINLFKKAPDTVEQQVTKAISRKQLAVSIFTDAIDNLKFSNEELNDALYDVDVEVAKLNAVRASVVSHIEENEKLIGNLGNLLK